MTVTINQKRFLCLILRLIYLLLHLIFVRQGSIRRICLHHCRLFWGGKKYNGCFIYNFWIIKDLHCQLEVSFCLAFTESRGDRLQSSAQSRTHSGRAVKA